MKAGIVSPRCPAHLEAEATSCWCWVALNDCERAVARSDVAVFHSALYGAASTTSELLAAGAHKKRNSLGPTASLVGSGRVHAGVMVHDGAFKELSPGCFSNTAVRADVWPIDRAFSLSAAALSSDTASMSACFTGAWELHVAASASSVVFGVARSSSTESASGRCNNCRKITVFRSSRQRATSVSPASFPVSFFEPCPPDWLCLYL
mmetsp:Transcript_3606/g.11287  ORF Transcript_3606/g.11287 Transcript_3606/m.11287 type:complete len:207 (-) Transcript_3606:386-1006(-)